MAWPVPSVVLQITLVIQICFLRLANSLQRFPKARCENFTWETLLHFWAPQMFMQASPVPLRPGSKHTAAVLRMRCKHNCPTAHRCTGKLLAQHHPAGAFWQLSRGTISTRQLIPKSMWVSINTVSRTGGWSGCCM